jgi:hypothetical protein
LLALASKLHLHGVGDLLRARETTIKGLKYVKSLNLFDREKVEKFKAKNFQKVKRPFNGLITV